MNRFRLRPILFASAGIVTAALAVYLKLPPAPSVPLLPAVAAAEDWVGSDPPTEQFDRDADSELQPARPCSAAIMSKTQWPSCYQPPLREVKMPVPFHIEAIELPRETRWEHYALDLRGRHIGRPGEVSVLAYTFEKVDHEGNRGFAVRVVNRTNANAHFGRCNSRLFLALEAMDAAGGWQAIEEDPWDWCGNAYFGRFVLKPGEFWEFTAPEFDGPFETVLRVRLAGLEDGRTLLSHAFPGRIHVEQFTPPPRER